MARVCACWSPQAPLYYRQYTLAPETAITASAYFSSVIFFLLQFVSPAVSSFSFIFSSVKPYSSSTSVLLHVHMPDTQPQNSMANLFDRRPLPPILYLSTLPARHQAHVYAHYETF